MEITPSQAQPPARSELRAAFLLEKTEFPERQRMPLRPQTAGPGDSRVQPCEDRDIGPIPIQRIRQVLFRIGKQQAGAGLVKLRR